MPKVAVLFVVVGLLSPAIGLAQTDPLAGEVRALSRTEVARIGGLDERPEYALTTVSGAAVLRGGQIALADRSTHEIRIFTVQGRFLRKMGREGDGPGEFRAIRQIVPLADDQILAWDVQRRRVSVFSVVGELVSTWLLDTQSLDVVFPSFVGAFPDGRVVVSEGGDVMGMRDETPGMRRDSVVFAIFDPGGELSGLTSPLEGAERRFYRDGTSWGTDRLLLARDLASAVTQEDLVAGLTDSLHLQRFDQSNGWTSYLRVERPVMPATRRLVEAERAVRMRDAEERAEAAPDPRLPFPGFRREAAQREIGRLKDLDHYRTRPAFGEVLAASDGRLWVSDYPDFVKGVKRWYRFDLDRRPSGRITFPIDERVVAAGFGLVLTIVKDEFDAETLVVYRLGSE